jgi:hypothetical protein
LKSGILQTKQFAAPSTEFIPNLEDGTRSGGASKLHNHYSIQESDSTSCPCLHPNHQPTTGNSVCSVQPTAPARHNTRSCTYCFSDSECPLHLYKLHSSARSNQSTLQRATNDRFVREKDGLQCTLSSWEQLLVHAATTSFQQCPHRHST